MEGCVSTHSYRSSQARLNSQLQDYIADVKAGKRDATIVEETLQTADFPEQDIAWTNLQRELQDVGIAPKLSTLDRESIISFLRKAAQEHDLLKTVDSKQSKSEDTPAPTIISEPGMNTSQLQPVRSSPNGPSRDNRISSKEVLPAEDFPIPVVSDLQDVDDSSKHAVPREDFPIPVALEPLIPQDDFDKQVMPADIHVPIPTDTATTSRSQHETASTPRPRSTPPLIARGKKPSLMSRMKYRMSNNKGEFIKLVKMGGLYSIKYALDQGANVNSTDRKGHTALVAAVSLCLEDVVSLLLEYGAKVNEVGSYGESALGVAASKGYDDLVQLLLVSGAEPDAAQSTRKLALCEAANCGSMTISKMLLDWGADVNAVDLTGKTALSYAASHGHSQIVQLLLENEAEVDKASRAGQTPLFQAVSIGNARCVELLLIFSADPHEPDVNGLSPMALAAQLGGTEVLRIFSDFGFGFRYYVM